MYCQAPLTLEYQLVGAPSETPEPIFDLKSNFAAGTTEVSRPVLGDVRPLKDAAWAA